MAGQSLPPGPKPLPIVGNIMDLPPKGVPEFQHWLKHKEAYGLISSVTVMGQTLVIIHDKQAAHHLMEKNSIKTSARPQFEFASKLCGFGEILASQQYGDKYRRGRKMVHQQLGTMAAATRYNDIQEVGARRFLLQVLNKPEHLIKHLKT
ncbi:cytochrome p450 [Hirsutella rhossiliensis]|uniref:Cytochrome p450 domain-containing protein n=1 Tax=Hirsutella rhossiliensis TaxID=111463 RepID=A0A9P8MNN9_9HYPO|nr:cytochrome p450 domain-containing protein [Hirsutella rhossiliensis]KAH0958297.1 cytochrome p450 domain-containing protein [Hirsutella rhossiliensis]